jgi:hypothetical protein
MAQLNLRSIHRSQLVNVSKRDGKKQSAVDMETEGDTIVPSTLAIACATSLPSLL